MVGLRDVELALIDLDGTVYVGSRPVAGAVDALARLRDLGLAIRFVTNTDSVTPAVLLDRLAGMGIQADESELLTPVVLARQFLDRLDAPRLLAVASPGVRELLGKHLAVPDEPVSHVLVCDPSYGASYQILDAAFRAVRAGAELLAAQVARIATRDDGEHLDTGGFVRLLEYATGQRARVLGKPSPDFFRLALERAGVAPQRAVMVGDDLEADVAGAQRIGVRGVLVRTGKGAQVQSDAAVTVPDATIDSLTALPDLLQ